jgi:tetratricopeptide (TPR) repeat protein
MSASPSAARRQQWLEQVDAALRTYGRDAAARLALQAVAEKVEHPALLNLAASAHHAQGRFDEAAKLLKRARTLAPEDPNVLNSLGVCLKALGDSAGALRAFDSAIRLAPHFAPAHFNRGALLEDENEIRAAKSAYERAASLDRTYAEPLASLSWLEAQAGDIGPARAHAEQTLALSPANVLARMALASADLQKGDHAAAASGLAALSRESSLTPVNRSIVLGLIGDLKDAEGRTGEAFAAYQASNAEVRALNRARFEVPGAETALDFVRRLTSWFERADAGQWREQPAARPRAGDPREHIFLVGFPRSGTTLLENVLAAHPQVVSLEERECLAPAEKAYLTSPQGLERLAKLSPGEALRQREAYWSRVRSFGVEPRGRVFIDKMPMSSVLLPLVSKVFPTARVLFARRDPRDVVLSCFRRRFGMNPAMYQLLTLEGAAAYYDAVMRLSQIYRDLLPLPQLIVRYESLVDEFEPTTRAVCDFVGLEWHQAMTDFAAKARSRGISTPSAAQVARGLNREGQGTWRRYAEQMTPVLPLLQPWVERFRYDCS